MYRNWKRMHYNKDQTRGFYTTGSRRSGVRQVVSKSRHDLMLLCFPTLRFRAPPSHTARARHPHETPFPSLSCSKFRYYTQHAKETIPNPLMPCDETRRHVVCGGVTWCDVFAHIYYLWRRPAQLGDGLRNLLNPGNTELGETSGTRNFLSLTSCCLCLWRRPAQPGDGPLNAYLLSLATASATWRRLPKKSRSRPAVRGPRLWPSANSIFDALSCAR